jgi:hypothetical protein
VKRVQLDQHSKDQKVFVNALAANDQKDSLIVQEIEKQYETICAIATSIKMGKNLLRQMYIIIRPKIQIQIKIQI